MWSLTGKHDSKKQRKNQPTQQAPAQNAPEIMDDEQLSKIVAAAMREVDPSSVQLTEEDENDPALLAEFSSLLNATADPQEQIADLEAQIKDAKSRCLQLAKEGKQEEAKTLLLEVRSLNEKVKSLQQLDLGGHQSLEQSNAKEQFVQIPDSPRKTPLQTSNQVQQQLLQQQIQQQNMINSFDTTRQSKKSDLGIVDEAELEKRVAVCKQIVVNISKIDRSKARNALSVLKSYQALLKASSEGDLITMDMLPPMPSEHFESDVQGKSEPKKTAKPPAAAPIIFPSVPQSSVSKSFTSPSIPDVSHTPITPIVASTPSSPKERLEWFNTLEEQIKLQKTQDNNAAVKYRDKGWNDRAKFYLKRRKQWDKDLEQLQCAKPHPQIPPPMFHFEEQVNKFVRTNMDLAEEAMEITITAVNNLRPSPNTTKMSVYAVLEFPSFADKAQPTKYSTETVNASAPQFQVSFQPYLLSIPRKKKGKNLVSKKIICSLFHITGLFAPFYSHNLLGRGEIKLDKLLNKCTAKLEVEIFEGKKATGTKVAVKLRVREPFEEQDIKVTKERLCIIDKHFTFEDVLTGSVVSYNQPQKQQPQPQPQPQQQPQPQPQPQSQPQPQPQPQTSHAQQLGDTESMKQTEQQMIVETTTPSTSPETTTTTTKPEATTTTTIKPEAATTATSTTTLPPSGTHYEESELTTDVDVNSSTIQNPAVSPPGKTQKLPASTNMKLPDTTSVDWLISNALLDLEQRKLQEIIEDAKKKHKQPSMEVTIRLNLVESKMMVLLIQIQQGKLTLEEYKQQVSAKIAEEKSLAKIFMTRGQKELASGCLQRASVMEKELAGEV